MKAYQRLTPVGSCRCLYWRHFGSSNVALFEIRSAGISVYIVSICHAAQNLTQQDFLSFRFPQLIAVFYVRMLLELDTVRLWNSSDSFWSFCFAVWYTLKTKPESLGFEPLHSAWFHKMGSGASLREGCPGRLCPGCWVSQTIWLSLLNNLP